MRRDGRGFVAGLTLSVVVILGVGLVFCAVSLLVGRSIYTRLSESRAAQTVSTPKVTSMQEMTATQVSVTRPWVTRTSTPAMAPTASVAIAASLATGTLTRTRIPRQPAAQSVVETPSVTSTAVVATPTSTTTLATAPTDTLTPSLSPSPTITPSPAPTPTPVAPTLAPTDTPTATPTEVALAPGWYVQNDTTFADSGGTVHVVGEVLNNTGDNQENVDLVVSFFDGTGRQVGEEIASPVVEVLPQGVTVPFEVAADLRMAYTNYEIVASGDSTSSQPRQDLEIISHSGIPGDPYRVVGEIGNRGLTLSSYAQIIATLYDGSGKVAGLGYDFISADSLGSGQMATFEVAIEDPLPGVVRYALVVLGF